MIRLGQIIETGHKRYPKVWLCKKAHTRIYIVMVLDKPQGQPANGWFTAYSGSLKDCRKYVETYQ